MRNNSVGIDMTHGLLHFPHLKKQVKTTSEISAKPQAAPTDDAVTIPSRTTKLVTALVDLPSECNKTGTVTPLEKFTQTTGLLISNSTSTKTDKKVAVRVTNRTETPNLIVRNTQIAEFSVVTPEQAIIIKKVDMVILNLSLKGDPHLTAYLNELPRTNQPEQQRNTFWFATPKNPGKNEDHTRIQTRNLKELYELKEKEKLNPKNETKYRKKLLEKFDWTDTLLTEKEEKATEDILVDYHDILAGHRNWILGWKKSSRWNLPQKTTKLCTAKVYSQFI